MPAAGPSFYAHVFHPAFNLDLEDAEEALDHFTTHTRAVGKGVQGLRNIFGQVRQARVGQCFSTTFWDYFLIWGIEMSEAERLLSYSLLSLITSQPLAAAPTTGIAEDDEEEYSSKAKGLLNADGAWCWREHCPGSAPTWTALIMINSLWTDCLKMTKAMQKTSESLQSVADLYDDHVRFCHTTESCDLCHYSCHSPGSADTAGDTRGIEGLSAPIIPLQGVKLHDYNSRGLLKAHRES